MAPSNQVPVPPVLPSRPDARMRPRNTSLNPAIMGPTVRSSSGCRLGLAATVGSPKHRSARTGSSAHAPPGSDNVGTMTFEDEGKNPGVAQEIPDVLPLLPVRDLVVFPYMIAPLRVSRPVSLDAVNQALATEHRMCFIVAQRDSNEEDPKAGSLYRTGTVGIVMRMRKLSDGGIKILVQGICRARIQRFLADVPSYKVRLDVIEEPQTQTSVEVEALVRTVKQNVERVAELGRTVQPELALVLQNVDEPGRMSDLVASNLTLQLEDAQSILETEDPVARLGRVNQCLENEIGILEMQNRIQSRAKEEMSKTQRDYYLREQLRQIRHELGDDNSFRDEIEEVRNKIEAAGLPPEPRAEANKQLHRLEQMSAESAEAAVVRSYLDLMVELPWKEPDIAPVDLASARKVLDEDHYDLEHIKDRILDYLAVYKLRKDGRGPILCFLGPPGVGKTSLGRSIARALGRKFVRISLGGVRDEAEIRGHRRTYVGAMPGRIIQSMRRAGSNNPVFILDEVDKIGADFRGDPSSALLEVLDPEQNSTFSDHYLEVDFDLSKVMFITTANLLDIPAPLMDRMEIIRIAGYTEDEKVEIARKHLIPAAIAKHGLEPKEWSIDDDGLLLLIRRYTREAGVRSLERELSTLIRKAVKELMTSKKKSIAVTAATVGDYLGVPKYRYGEIEAEDLVGMVTGLAWTDVGGELLTIEGVMMPGKGKMTVTGNLRDVMKESISAAASYVRSRAVAFGIEPPLFDKRDIHVHVPEGATPKDGPSAGVAMVTAIVSVMTGIPIRRDVAMTGEITLRGRILPIGGLKEKLLAALRA